MLQATASLIYQKKKKLVDKLSFNLAPKLEIFKPQAPELDSKNMYANMAKTCPVCGSTCSADSLKNNNKCHNCNADLSGVKMILITGRFPKKR